MAMSNSVLFSIATSVMSGIQHLDPSHHFRSKNKEYNELVYSGATTKATESPKVQQSISNGTFGDYEECHHFSLRLLSGTLSFERSMGKLSL